MYSILYVDDEPDLLEIGKIFLERSGTFHVDTMESAILALERIRNSSYDAIISDYQMPQMDGIAFLKEIRHEYPDLPFIIFTGKGREEVVIAALNNGADHYLQKGGEPTAQFAELAHNLNLSIERRRSKETIIHLNRIYSMVSRMSKAMVNIGDRSEFLNEACKIGVEEGKFLMTWIGMLDFQTHMIHPVAACGYEEGYLSLLTISVDNVPQGMGLSGMAVRDGHPTFSNNIQTDPRMATYWGEAEKRGYHSSAAVPIKNGKYFVGVMRFYSGEINFFNEKEINLLQEIVDNISFALEMQEKRML